MGKGSKPRRTSDGKRRSRGGAPVGHSRAGRPRKAGPRYANGRLKPPGPNEKVVEQRRALLGDRVAVGKALKAAENPLDLMLARGWLQTELHQAGRAFARLHACGRMSVPSVRTTSFDAPVRAANTLTADPVSLWRLREIWETLAGRPASVAALVDVCVIETWPAWLAGAAFASDDEVQTEYLNNRGRAALNHGLQAVADVIARPVPEDLKSGTDLSVFVDWLRRPVR